MLYGVGSLAEQIYQYNVRYQLYDIVAFIDDSVGGERQYHSLPVLTYNEFKREDVYKDCCVIVTVGYTKCNTIRQRICEQLIADKYCLANFIAPNSNCWPDSIVGKNVVVFDNVFIGVDAKIHTGVIVYEGTIIPHNVEIKEYSLLSAGVVLGGHSVVGKNCFLGLNSTIKSSSIIGSYNIVASGANVIRSSEDFCVIKGNPGIAIQKDTLSVKI